MDIIGRMRAAFVLAIAIGVSGCVNSAFYHAGPHSFATLDRPGDGYVAYSVGWVPTTIYDGQGESRTVQGAYALGRIAIFARASEASKSWNLGTSRDGHLAQSAVEVGVGPRAKTSGSWRTQSLLAIGRASSDATLRGDPFGGGEEDRAPPQHRAYGRYWRVYAQHSNVARKRYADVGAALRVSVVHADRFQRRAYASTASPPPRDVSESDYTIVMADTGSRTGAFLEPGMMFRFGYKRMKFGPDLSYTQPLMKSAFKAQRFHLSASVSLNIEPGRPR